MLESLEDIADTRVQNHKDLSQRSCTLIIGRGVQNEWDTVATPSVTEWKRPKSAAPLHLPSAVVQDHFMVC